MGDVGGQLPKLMGTALLQLPAAWTLGAFAFALTGMLPRFTAIAWALFAVFVLIGYVGELLNLPEVALGVSPFRHTPRFPVTDISATPLLVLGAVAVALGWFGYVGLRRRDILSG
jgi:ABC-2 type transport system permease protein